MVPDYIALAGPAFFVLIVVELFVERRRGVSYYRVNDAINSISTGLLMQLSVLFAKGLLVAGYLGIYENFRLVDLSAVHAGTWLACFFGVDCAYYWFHRLHHQVRALWAAHVNHHSSTRYNFSTALRQSWTTPFTGFLFWVPLPLLGFPVEMILIQKSISLLYQYWLHTELIGKLGWFGVVFNTPSHHRVHHGRNVRYLDRNYAGIFIDTDGNVEHDNAI